MQVEWLVQRIVNTATACINNRDSSGDDDNRYKQRINSGNVGGKNYNDESIAQQWGNGSAVAGASATAVVM